MLTIVATTILSRGFDHLYKLLCRQIAAVVPLPFEPFNGGKNNGQRFVRTPDVGLTIMPEVFKMEQQQLLFRRTSDRKPASFGCQTLLSSYSPKVRRGKCLHRQQMYFC